MIKLHNKRFESILFDLDGTLLDTAPDMIGAINAMLENRQLSPLDYANARPYVSHGSKALVELGFATEPAESKQKLIQEFLEVYATNISEKTELFEGMQDWIQRLERRNVNWGIVTNKPEYLTVKLLNEMNLPLKPGCVIAGDSLIKRKPHPMPVMHAAALLRTPAHRCIYVGDARADISAGQCAGMYTIAANYGYIIPHENPLTWNAHAYAESVEHLIELADELLFQNHSN